MTLLSPKQFPFSYLENGSIANITIQTQVDDNSGTGKVPEANVSVKETNTSVATYTPATNTITPVRNADGSFTSSDSLRVELGSNTNLANSIDASVRSATQEFLGGAGVSQESVSVFLNNPIEAATFAPPTETQSAPNGGTSPNPVALPVQPFNPNNSNDKAKGSGLRYPAEAGDTEDFITFEAYTYSPKSDDILGDSEGKCILSIQPTISDSNTVGWGDGRINALQAAVFDAAKAGIGQGFGAMGDKARAAAEAFYADTNKGADFQVYAAGQAAQVNDAFVRETGKVLNPNLQLLFQGPELRSFNFTFQLSARNQGEANNIRQIIRFFKKNMAPTKSDNDIFLKSPNVFKISYSEKVKKSLNKFKTCALRSFSVDYTPLGTYMTFEDGTMVSYSLTMAFQELFPLYNTNEDYGSATEIGF